MRKYLETTMSVASCDQAAGISAPSILKTTEPSGLVMTLERRSQVTVSSGSTPRSVVRRSKREAARGGLLRRLALVAVLRLLGGRPRPSRHATSSRHHGHSGALRHEAGFRVHELRHRNLLTTQGPALRETPKRASRPGDRPRATSPDTVPDGPAGPAMDKPRRLSPRWPLAPSVDGPLATHSHPHRFTPRRNARPALERRVLGTEPACGDAAPAREYVPCEQEGERPASSRDLAYGKTHMWYSSRSRHCRGHGSTC